MVCSVVQVLCLFIDALTEWPVHYFKRAVEVSHYYCCPLLPLALSLLHVSMCSKDGCLCVIVLSSLWIVPFIIIIYPLSSFLTAFELVYFVWCKHGHSCFLLLAIYMEYIFVFFYFQPKCILYLEWVSCEQHRVGFFLKSIQPLYRVFLLESLNHLYIK